MSSSSDEFEWEKDPDPFGFNAEWEELEAARVARQAGGEKALEPGTAAVAAEPGVYHLVLENHCAPPDASAVCQRHDTDCHAISGEQFLARKTYFGEFPDAADFLQEELTQNMWHDVSQAPVAKPQDGWQPMYVPNGNALPRYLPSQ